MVPEMFCSLGCQVGEKCLELPCDDDVAIYLVLGFVRPNRSSNSHERDIEKIVIQSIRVTRDTLAVVSSSYPVPKYKTPANAHILFTTPCPRLYRYTLLSLSLSLQAASSFTFCQQCHPRIRSWALQPCPRQLCSLYGPTFSGGPSSPTQSTRTLVSWG